MSAIRLAGIGDLGRQKELWKLCFGDSDQYVDFYYANRYQADETLLLVEDGEIVTMLTMLPITIILPDKRSFKAAMLYAIATHPHHRRRGLAAQLIGFAHRYLAQREKAFTVMVPSTPQLFSFYRPQGYEDGFYIRETLLTAEEITRWACSDSCSAKIAKLSPANYNQRRNDLLSGRFHVAYAETDIAYQQKLSQQFGGDLLGMDTDAGQGCAAVERLHSGQVFIRELLLPKPLIRAAVQQIAQIWRAQQYVVRTPAFLGQQLEGTLRTFGMIKALQATELEVKAESQGYLGLAFD